MNEWVGLTKGVVVSISVYLIEMRESKGGILTTYFVLSIPNNAVVIS